MSEVDVIQCMAAWSSGLEADFSRRKYSWSKFESRRGYFRFLCTFCFCLVFFIIFSPLACFPLFSLLTLYSFVRFLCDNVFLVLFYTEALAGMYISLTPSPWTTTMDYRNGLLNGLPIWITKMDYPKLPTFIV